jgi:hypothetical protein
VTTRLNPPAAAPTYVTESADHESEDLDGVPDPEAVAHRARGRPPEEASSDDPMAQSETILEDSEERTAEGAEGSEPTSE